MAKPKRPARDREFNFIRWMFDEEYRKRVGVPSYDVKEPARMRRADGFDRDEGMTRTEP